MIFESRQWSNRKYNIWQRELQYLKIDLIEKVRTTENLNETVKRKACQEKGKNKYSTKIQWYCSDKGKWTWIGERIKKLVLLVENEIS